MRISKIFCLALAVLALLAAFGFRARAATPAPFTGVIIDWRTQTYVPPAFQGKRLPTAVSPIVAWVTVFNNGKPVSASDYSIRWYANDQLLQSGNGITSVSFRAPTGLNQVVNLQARVQSPAGDLTVANLQVPVISPKLALVSSYPNNTITGSPANLVALPYFFNVSGASSLSFSWSANGSPAQNAENPDRAVINIGDTIPSGSTLSINVTATNPADGASASASNNYIYQKL